MRHYWQKRSSNLYYAAVYQIVSVVGKDATSIVDVGSSETDYITWFYWIDRKTQINLTFENAVALPGVERVETDFLAWQQDRPFDVALCLQVLEHVPEPTAFCDKLKASAQHLVVSVPYKWKAGGTKGHIHDPVDKQKLRRWMRLEPNYNLIVREPFGPARLICYYDLMNGPEQRVSAKLARREKQRRARGR